MNELLINNVFDKGKLFQDFVNMAITRFNYFQITSVPLEYHVCFRFFQYYFSRIASNISCYDDNKKDKHFVNANSRGHTQKTFS